MTLAPPHLAPAPAPDSQAPPTPGERSNNVLGGALNEYFGEDKRDNYDKYKGDLPESLAFRTSTQAMVRSSKASRSPTACAATASVARRTR